MSGHYDPAQDLAEDAAADARADGSWAQRESRVAAAVKALKPQDILDYLSRFKDERPMAHAQWAAYLHESVAEDQELDS